MGHCHQIAFWGMAVVGRPAGADKRYYMQQRRLDPRNVGQNSIAPTSHEPAPSEGNATVISPQPVSPLDHQPPTSFAMRGKGQDWTW